MKKTILLLMTTLYIGCFASVFAQDGVLFRWRPSTTDTPYNFNPSVLAGDSNAIVFDSLPYAKDYTMIIVYKALNSAEATLWRLDYPDGGVRGLTTERLTLDNSQIRMSHQAVDGPVINTLRQTAPDSASPFVRLTVGGDTLGGRFKVAEVIYFDHRLGNGELRRVQGPLAIRYGVTLGPVNYLDGMGNIVWHHAEQYRHRITGLGRDSVWLLNQTVSRSETDGAMLTLSISAVAEGMFLVCGDNDQPPAFVESDGMELMGREWRVEATNMADTKVSLSFDMSEVEGGADSVVLVVDGYPYRPSAAANHTVRFDSIVFDSDTAHFTLGRGALLWTLADMGNSRRSGQSSMNHDMGYPKVSSTVYPNPSMGEYTVEVSGSPWVRVEIFSSTGVMVASYSDKERDGYKFTGTLPTGAIYYVTVTTDEGCQTMKLSVR